MAATKQKMVFTAEAHQLEEIQAVVREGQYRSASEFLREAIDEKLARLRIDRVAEQVERYCAEGYGNEDRDLAEHQAFDSNDS